MGELGECMIVYMCVCVCVYTCTCAPGMEALNIMQRDRNNAIECRIECSTTCLPIQLTSIAMQSGYYEAMWLP